MSASSVSVTSSPSLRRTPTARRVSSRPSRASPCACRRRSSHERLLGARLHQRGGCLQLDRQPGQRMSEHVVYLSSDPCRLLQARRAQLLLARALRLGEQELGLVGSTDGLAGVGAGELHRGEPEPVGQGLEGRLVIDQHAQRECEQAKEEDSARLRELETVTRGRYRHKRERAAGSVGRRRYQQPAGAREHEQIRRRDAPSVGLPGPTEPAQDPNDQQQRDHQAATRARRAGIGNEDRPADQDQAKRPDGEGHPGVQRLQHQHVRNAKAYASTSALWSVAPRERTASTAVRPSTSAAAMPSIATVHASRLVIECCALK